MAKGQNIGEPTISFLSDHHHETTPAGDRVRLPSTRQAVVSPLRHWQSQWHPTQSHLISATPPLDGSSNSPTWSRDIDLRGAILERPGKCYRCGVTYNAPLNTYLLAMTPGGDTREAGGLAVYAASHPWGPWRTIFETDDWDIGPGESASFPSKWMSADGRTVHLVFSGNDCFSVRKGTLRLEKE